MKHRRKSKSIFVDSFVKIKADAKCFVWNFFVIGLIKRMVQWKISTACTAITAYNVAKSKRNVQRHCQHEEFVTTYWMFGKNAGNFQYSVRPCQRWGDWKRGNGKRKTEKWHWKTRNRHTLTNSTLTRTYDTYLIPIPLSLKLSIRHFAINVVMLYSLK